MTPAPGLSGGFRSIEEIMDLKQKARPGDLLFSFPKNQSLPASIGRKAVVELPQGTKFGHAAIVSSNNSVVEAQIGGVDKLSLDRWVEGNTAILARVKASPDKRQEAAKRAEDLTGRSFSIWKAFRSYIWPKKKDMSIQKVRQKASRMKSMFCSTVVAIAYPDVDFHVGKDKLDVLPVDILRSDKVEIIGKSFDEDRKKLIQDVKSHRPDTSLFQTR